MSGANLFAIADIKHSRGIFLSTNNGTSWTSAGLTNDYVQALVASGSNLFACFQMSIDSLGDHYNYSNVSLSTNNGTSWTEVDIGLPKTSINTLATNETSLFVGTSYYGIWRRPLSEMVTSVKKVSNDFPRQFSLNQNYPDPFNPTTTISFTIPSRSSVSLKIFDMLGREVATIVSGEMPAGTYSRQWNAAKMSSGIYFYRLVAGSYTQTKKLVLLK